MVYVKVKDRRKLERKEFKDYYIKLYNIDLLGTDEGFDEAYWILDYLICPIFLSFLKADMVKCII